MSARLGSSLAAEIGLLLPYLDGAAHRLWNVHDLRERYARYLSAMHAVTRASVPLMETAVARCAALPAGDPVAARLGAYLSGHIEEERDHDAWVLDDLAAIGHDPARTLARPPGAGVAALVGAQYYWILHFHPVALLGYLAVLEGHPPSSGLAGVLSRRTGLPEAGFHSLRAHAVDDRSHAAELFALLDALPLSEQQADAVRRSALATVEGATGLLLELGGRRAGHG